MKTATLPSLRVEPALREAAESVLKEGETLSGFVEASVRAQVELRQQREAFIARGIASRDKARQTGVYYSADEVMAELRGMLDAAKSRKRV
jgi:hypothetical protein